MKNKIDYTYNRYAVKNNKNQYIKYPTAYSEKIDFTDSLYDVYLWDLKEDAQRLVDSLTTEDMSNMIVVLV